MQGLETRISELETETERLSLALEAQKANTAHAEAAGTKKVEEMANELRRKASLELTCEWGVTDFCGCCRARRLTSSKRG